MSALAPTLIDRTAMLLAADGAAEASRLLRVAAEGTSQPAAPNSALTVVLAGVVLEHCPVTAETALRAGQALAAAAARRLATMPTATSQEDTDAAGA
ncbi:MAG: hypothetical protein IT341_06880 [Chloroflexi bacterium]|nr:hypothetical protein [Chloroflexota bacterium]